MVPGKRRDNFWEKDLVDLHGKVVIITGGAKVYITSENEQITKNTIRKLEEAGIGDGSIHWLEFYLDDPRSAVIAAQEFLEKEDRLDILILNNTVQEIRGIFGFMRSGIRRATPTLIHLSHFVFTECLLPLLTQTSKQKNSDVRILNVANIVRSKMSNFIDSLTPSNLDTRFNDHVIQFVINSFHIHHLQHRITTSRSKSRSKSKSKSKSNIICMLVESGNDVLLADRVNSMPWVLRIFVVLVLVVFFSIFGDGSIEGGIRVTYAAAALEVKAKEDKFKGAMFFSVDKIVKVPMEAWEKGAAKEYYEASCVIVKGMIRGFEIVVIDG